MRISFKRNELDIIKESLDWSKYKISEYGGYPSYAFKLSQVKRIEDVRQKIMNARKQYKKKNRNDRPA